MDNLQKTKTMQSILVTSTRPHTNGNSVAADLAVLITQSGKKVALIDADLHHPVIHKVFELPNRVGLLNTLLNRRSPISVMHSLMNGKLSVLTSGKVPNSQVDLLSSSKMTNFLQSIKLKFDKVIIQGPSFFYTETFTLAAQADGVILIINPGYAKSETSRIIMERLQRTGTTIIGIVMRNQPKHQSSQSAFINRLLSYDKRIRISP